MRKLAFAALGLLARVGRSVAGLAGADKTIAAAARTKAKSAAPRKPARATGARAKLR